MKTYTYTVVTSSTDYSGTVEASTASQAITKVIEKHPGTLRHQVHVSEAI